MNTYVDDIRVLVSKIEKGLIWDTDTKSLKYDNIQFLEDSDKCDVTKATEVISTVMNNVTPDLKFTLENQIDYHDSYIPKLDFSLILSNNLLSYIFYKKPMASKCAILQQSL